MLNTKDFVVIGGVGNHELDSFIIKDINDLTHGKLKFLHLNIDTYPDGEPDLRIENHKEIKGKHVLLFQSIYTGNLKSQFLTLAWAAKRQYGAKSVTAIVPFMRYRRQENEKNIDEINRNKMFIEDMEHKGIDRVIFCDIHSQHTMKYCKKVGIEAYNVDPSPAYARKLRVFVDVAKDAGREFLLYSPDGGRIEATAKLAKELGVGIIADLKGRAHDGKVKTINIKNKLKKLSKKHGVKIMLPDKHVKGASIGIREDEKSTGGTANIVGRRLTKLGAYEVIFCATHPVCAPGWKRKLIDKCSFTAIFSGNTIPRNYEKSTGGKITTIHMSNVIAQRLLRVMHSIK